MKKFEPEKMTDPRTGEILTLHFEDRGDGQPQLAQVTLPGPPLPPDYAEIEARRRAKEKEEPK